MKPGDLAGAILKETRCLGFALDPAVASRMQQHFELLQRWSRAVDLTSIREPARAVPFYVEPVLVLDLFGSAQGATLLDLGSGGGFPGLILAMLRPCWRVLLVERGARKAAFLAEAARQLGLPKVEVLELNLGSAADLPGGIDPDRLTLKAVGGGFHLALDLLELRGAGSARAVIFTGTRGALDLARMVERRSHRLKLDERRKLPGRRSSYAVVVQRVV